MNLLECSDKNIDKTANKRCKTLNSHDASCKKQTKIIGNVKKDHKSK